MPKKTSKKEDEKSKKPGRKPDGVDRRSLFLRYFLDQESKRTFFNCTESAIAAGFTAKTRNGYGRKGSDLKRAFQKEILEYLDDNHLDEASLKRRLIDLLDANETKYFAYKGHIITEREVPDLPTRQKALNMAFKAKRIGAYSEELEGLPDIEIEIKHVTDKAPLTGKARMLEIIEEMKALRAEYDKLKEELEKAPNEKAD